MMSFENPTIWHIPNTSMFFPDGNFELERVETSLSISDLQDKKKNA